MCILADVKNKRNEEASLQTKKIQLNATQILVYGRIEESFIIAFIIIITIEIIIKPTMTTIIILIKMITIIIIIIPIIIREISIK